MKKIAVLILLVGLYGMANAQFQSDDEVVTAALNQKKFVTIQGCVNMRGFVCTIM